MVGTVQLVLLTKETKSLKSNIHCEFSNCLCSVIHYLFQPTLQCQSQFNGRRERLDVHKKAFSGYFFSICGCFLSRQQVKRGNLASKPNQTPWMQLTYLKRGVKQILQNKRKPASKATSSKEKFEEVICEQHIWGEHISAKTSPRLQLRETQMCAVLRSADVHGYLAWKNVTVGQTSRWIWSLYRCS